MATNAATPYGYSLVFANKQASLQASVFLTLATISSYDVAGCQSLCDRDSQCVAFNMYAERDPTLAPDASNCPNPSSTTNYKVCAAVDSLQNLTNSFQVCYLGSTRDRRTSCQLRRNTCFLPDCHYSFKRLQQELTSCSSVRLHRPYWFRRRDQRSS
jgi:hypothetical protein